MFTAPAEHRRSSRTPWLYDEIDRGYITRSLCVCLVIEGIKFIVITDPRRNAEELLLKKLYELYADFALKNPFYSLDMPIR